MPTFAELHRGGVLVLPNAWDVASAVIVASAGAAAVATTSAGVAWGLGAPDGDRLDRDRALDLVARIAAAVDVPVTADLEGGYADTPEGVAETVRRAGAAGAAGVNLEDADHGGTAALLGVDVMVDRLAAARAATPTVFLNARVDTYLRGRPDPLRETVARAVAYVEAGADGVFVPGVVDPATLAVLVAEIPAPLNVMAGPGAPPVAELAALGVARVSVGPALAQAAYATTRRAARELLADGTYGAMADAIPFPEMNALLTYG